ncbi:hypothetical protein [Kluyvera georgiana]|uniref:hypothetical protein n=1 Tax=Kluyvera georgiana TaxID=73098 RepID=UPI003AEF592A
MAFDIFSGATLTVEIGTHTVGSTEVATDFVEIPEISAFPQIGLQSTVIDVVTYNSKYNRKLLGTASVPDLELTMNFIPDNEVQAKVLALADSQVRAQFRITYYMDETKTNSYSVTYVGFVSNTQSNGSKDEVVTRNITISIDGAPLKTTITTPEDAGTGS